MSLRQCGQEEGQVGAKWGVVLNVGLRSLTCSLRPWEAIRVRSEVLLEEEQEAQSPGFLGLPLSLSAGVFCPQSHHHLSK